MSTNDPVVEQNIVPEKTTTPSFLPEHTESPQETSEYAEEAKAFELYAPVDAEPAPEDDFLDEEISNLTKQAQQQTTARPTQVAQVRDPITAKIEFIMEDGLVDAFREMTAVQQQEFKIKGEQTAHDIRQLLSQSKIKVKKIFLLLLEWLKLIPGVNRFFIEQEAKIKADKIFGLRLQDIH